ncbi:MAG TPA: GNAT family N-acetyltransferase [Acidimicrobiia bacterium]|jgi:phosphinothricin acetyltransferase
MGVVIRRGTSDDIPRLTEIYNHWIVGTHVSFDREPQTEEWRRAWFEKYSDDGRYQLFVGEVDGVIVGMSYSSPFRAKEAYETTVETTVVLDEAAIGHGYGRMLLERLVEELEKTDTHRAIAGVALPNDASVMLHADLGYRTVGVYDEVGRKFGKYWSVQMMERRLDG